MTDGFLHASWRPAAGILYAEDFDDEPVPAVAQLEPSLPEPVFSAVELEEARSVAAAAAREAATEEALGAAEAAFLRAREAILAGIADGMARLQAGVESEVGRATAELSRLVLSLLSAALPSLMEGTARREIGALLRQLLPGLVTEKRVTVRVPPALVDAVASDLLLLDEDLRDRVELVGADALEGGDVRVSWHEGRLVRDTGAVARAVHDIVAAAAGPDAVHA